MANTINVFKNAFFIVHRDFNRSQLIFSGLSSEAMLQGLAPVMRLLPLANGATTIDSKFFVGNSPFFQSIRYFYLY